MNQLSKAKIMKDLKLQEAIISHYYPNAIQGKLFKIRDERTPSANLKIFKGVLFLTDFGNEQKGKNCLDIVMENEGCDYKEALQLISSRFSNYSPLPSCPSPTVYKKKESTALEIKKKPFTQSELDYFGVNQEILDKYSVYSLASYGKLTSSPEYFLFLYDFGKFIKINRPHDKENRFFWKGPRPRDFIFGWDQLVEKPEFIILTAGEKDVLNFSAHGFSAISLNSESARLTKEQFFRLKKKTNKLFVCFDLDEAGRKNAAALVDEHPEIYNLQLPVELRQHNDFRANPCKDVADFFRYYTSDDFRNLMASTTSIIKPSEHVEKYETGTPMFTVVKNFLTKNYDLRFNEISNEYEYKLKDEAKYRELNESNIYVTLKERKIHITVSDLTAILRSDFVRHYNPFIDYFISLPDWDPVNDPDYIEQVADYVEAVNRSRFITHFKKHLVRTIACALDDDVFNKQAFILVSATQNSGKSTFCRWLCPPALKNYFAENISTDKDSRISICENIFINLDELSTQGRTEIQSMKSLFSKDKEKLRRPYDRKATIIPRIASFIGSTDRTEFLNDEAGTVRWLCMEIKGIDFNYKRDLDINKIWCQAYHLYKNGFKGELTSEEIRENESINKAYQFVTIEMDVIQDLFYPGTSDKNDGFITAMKFIEIINLDRKEIANRINPISLGKAFRSLGFIRSQKVIEKSPRHGYYVRFTDQYIHRYGKTDQVPGYYIPAETEDEPKPISKQDDLPF